MCLTTHEHVWDAHVLAAQAHDDHKSPFPQKVTLLVLRDHACCTVLAGRHCTTSHAWHNLTSCCYNGSNSTRLQLTRCIAWQSIVPQLERRCRAPCCGAWDARHPTSELSTVHVDCPSGSGCAKRRCCDACTETLRREGLNPYIQCRRTRAPERNSSGSSNSSRQHQQQIIMRCCCGCKVRWAT